MLCTDEQSSLLHCLAEMTAFIHPSNLETFESIRMFENKACSPLKPVALNKI